MIKKLLWGSFSVLFILFIYVSLAFAIAGDTGPASVYKVTIVKFELRNKTSLSWVTAFEGSSVTIDIASVSAGSAAGNFFSGLDIADGIYDQVRVTSSDTFTISGNVGSLYTTADTTSGASAGTTTAADQAEAAIDIPGGIGTPPPDTLPTELTITNGVPSHSIRVNFDVSQAIREVAGNGLVPAPPVVTMTMTAL